MVQRAFIRIVDQETNQEIVRFDLTEEACMWSCMMFGELYLYAIHKYIRYFEFL